MDTPQDLQEILSKLNINVPKDSDEADILLPQWKDITSFLDEATNDFEVGQLLSLKSFTLYEAMSAIELMNPRMDTGVPAEALVPNIDISNQLSAEEVLSVMDSLVAREIAWLSGHSISQTVYTCVYFHHLPTLNETPISAFNSENISGIVNDALKMYLNTTLSCCRFIWEEMIQGNVYEEEDFTTNLCGLTLENQLSDNCILDGLNLCIKNIRALIDKTAVSASVYSILNRLEIRHSFFLALTHLSQNEVQGLTHAKIELENMAILLKQTNVTSCGDVQGVFDPNINRNLTSQTPPRPVELESNEKSYVILSQIIYRLLSICDVVNYTSVISLMNYFDAFGAKTPHADAFSRSKLNTILYSNSKVFGIHDLPSLILRSIEEMIKPPTYWLSVCDENHLPTNVNMEQFLNGHESLKSFLDRISMVFLELFKINCHNRSRQRRILCKMVGEWQILEEEAAAIDEMFHEIFKKDADSNMPYYFSSWAYHIKMLIMEKIVLMGFELELYGQHEYTMILWFVRTLLDSRIFLLSRMDRHTVQESDYIKGQLYLNQATSALIEGLLRAAVTLEYTHQRNQKRPLYDDGMTRYLQRFKPFFVLASPPLPQYESYIAIVSTEEIDLDKMKPAIKDNFSRAKKLLNEYLKILNNEESAEKHTDYLKKNITDIMRTCVANDIGVNHITQKGDQVSFMFKYHPWFPVLTK